MNVNENEGENDQANGNLYLLERALNYHSRIVFDVCVSVWCVFVDTKTQQKSEIRYTVPLDVAKVFPFFHIMKLRHTGH